MCGVLGDLYVAQLFQDGTLLLDGLRRRRWVVAAVRRRSRLVWVCLRLGGRFAGIVALSRPFATRRPWIARWGRWRRRRWRRSGRQQQIVVVLAVVVQVDGVLPLFLQLVCHLHVRPVIRVDVSVGGGPVQRDALPAQQRVGGCPLPSAWDLHGGTPIRLANRLRSRPAPRRPSPRTGPSLLAGGGRFRPLGVPARGRGSFRRPASSRGAWFRGSAPVQVCKSWWGACLRPGSCLDVRRLAAAGAGEAAGIAAQGLNSEFFVGGLRSGTSRGAHVLEPVALLATHGPRAPAGSASFAT